MGGGTFYYEGYVGHCSLDEESGSVWCLINDWEETKPVGEVYFSNPNEVPLYPPSGMYPANSVTFDSNGNASFEASFPTGLGVVTDGKPGEVWYYGDHVFGVTSSGLTYWNSRTGKGAFISPNAYIPF